MALKMKPITDEAGRLRPDLDARHVPVSVMAKYFDIAPSTVWKRCAAGIYPRAGLKLIGGMQYYIPRVVMGFAP